MAILFEFNPSWYILLFTFITSWTILVILRRNKSRKKEIKEQIFIGFFGLIAMAVMELFAVYAGLWDYIPGNWPVILWPTYIAAILFGYQLLRSIEVLLKRPIIVS